MQSIVALCGKLIRVFYALLRTGNDYSAEKMLGDIKQSMKQQLNQAGRKISLLVQSESSRRSSGTDKKTQDFIKKKSRDSQVEQIHKGEDPAQEHD